MPSKVTFVRAPFAGRERTFQLRFGEAAELERLCGNSGIGLIAQRLLTMSYFVADVRETVRLGLRGGGLSDPEATALVMSAVDDVPLAEHGDLAARIVDAFINGLPDELKKKPARQAGRSSPET